MIRIAPCSKDIKHFFNDGRVPAASGHSTQFFLNSKNAQTTWVLKRFEKGELAQIEAGLASLYHAMAKSGAIPKVYAVYRKAEGVLPQFFSSVSAVFSEFQDLQTYLSGGLTEAKLSFLIENGFPEICALSYFLEEDDLHKGNIGICDGKVVRIDFDMSAFSIVGKEELRGSRSTLDSRRLEDVFAITAKDIEHFPELLDAKPYYFPGVFRMIASANGYAADEVKNFIALQKDARFVRRAYSMLLKILVMPDDIFSRLLSAHIGNPEIVLKLSEHFISRKKILREVLLSKNECHKFKNYLETLSAEEIKLIFHEIDLHNLKNKFDFQKVDVGVAQSNFYHFIYDSMKVGDLSLFLSATAHLAKDFSEDKLTLLKQAREALLHYYQWLTEKELLSLDDVVFFVKEMKRNIAIIKNLFEPADQQVDALYMNIHARLDRLERNGHAAKLSEVTGFSPTEEFTLIDFPVDYAEQLNQRKLVVDTIRWMQQEDKKSVIVAVMERIAAEVKIQQATIMARISSAVASVATGASSFFRSPVAAAPVIELQLQQLRADFDADKQVFRTIFHLLSLTGDGAEQLKNKIIFEFIAQFVREFLEKSTIEQMQIDPVLFGFLTVQSFFSYSSKGADELIKLFKNEVQPNLVRFMEPEVKDVVAVVASHAM